MEGIIRGHVIDVIDPNFFELLIFTSKKETNHFITELVFYKSKESILRTEILGREIEFKPNTLLIYIYDDGTKEKKITQE